jgi:hypothetical protein
MSRSWHLRWMAPAAPPGRSAVIGSGGRERGIGVALLRMPRTRKPRRGGFGQGAEQHQLNACTRTSGARAVCRDRVLSAHIPRDLAREEREHAERAADVAEEAVRELAEEVREHLHWRWRKKVPASTVARNAAVSRARIAALKSGTSWPRWDLLMRLQLLRDCPPGHGSMKGPGCGSGRRPGRRRGHRRRHRGGAQRPHRQRRVPGARRAAGDRPRTGRGRRAGGGRAVHLSGLEQQPSARSGSRPTRRGEGPDLPMPLRGWPARLPFVQLGHQGRPAGGCPPRRSGPMPPLPTMARRPSGQSRDGYREWGPSGAGSSFRRGRLARELARLPTAVRSGATYGYGAANSAFGSPSPKMPGEPRRVQPSRAKRPASGNE